MADLATSSYVRRAASGRKADVPDQLLSATQVHGASSKLPLMVSTCHRRNEQDGVACLIICRKSFAD